MITHQLVKRPAWKTFADMYGDYRPRGVVLFHPPASHNADYCVETRNRPDTDFVHNMIERSSGQRQRIVSGRKAKLRLARERYRKEAPHGGKVATHV